MTPEKFSQLGIESAARPLQEWRIKNIRAGGYASVVPRSPSVIAAALRIRPRGVIAFSVVPTHRVSPPERSNDQGRGDRDEHAEGRIRGQTETGRTSRRATDVTVRKKHASRN